MHVALNYCKKLKDSDIVVVILGDSGRAYLSKVFKEETLENASNKNVPEIKHASTLSK
jgi:hypothetical protein